MIGRLYFNSRGLMFVKHRPHNIHISTLVLWLGFSHSFTHKSTQMHTQKSTYTNPCIHGNIHKKSTKHIVENQTQLDCEKTLSTN